MKKLLKVSIVMLISLYYCVSMPPNLDNAMIEPGGHQRVGISYQHSQFAYETGCGNRENVRINFFRGDWQLNYGVGKFFEPSIRIGGIVGFADEEDERRGVSGLDLGGGLKFSLPRENSPFVGFKMDIWTTLIFARELHALPWGRLLFLLGFGNKGEVITLGLSPFPYFQPFVTFHLNPLKIFLSYGISYGEDNGKTFQLGFGYQFK